MHIESIQIGNFVPSSLQRLDAFFQQTVFVLSHKDEGVRSLQSVLSFLPGTSTVMIVSNCPESEIDRLRSDLALWSAGRTIFLVHQKDPALAALLRDRGVYHILGSDGLIANGKGEGMYIGTLCAALLGFPRWITFFDADNRVPCALLEYTLAMAQLFMEAEGNQGIDSTEPIHNIRICWACKPDLSRGWLHDDDEDTNKLGRCTREVSPLVHQVFDHWFPEYGLPIITSNAGEEGFSFAAAKNLQFASGYAVETHLLLGLLQYSLDRNRPVLLQQYLAKSPHFHSKGDDAHIRRMIAESLGCFSAFARIVPTEVMHQIQLLCDRLGIEPIKPRVYPAIRTLGLIADPSFLRRYSLAAQEQETAAGMMVGAE